MTIAALPCMCRRARRSWSAIAKYDWKYETEPDPSRNGRVDNWPSGKVLGGGGSINGMVYLRGNPADYERWVQRGAQGLELSTRCCRTSCAPSATRMAPASSTRTKGLLGVANLRVTASLQSLVHRRLCRSRHSSERRTSMASLRKVSVTTRRRNGAALRCSAARGYLRPIRGHKNLTLLTRAFVSRDPGAQWCRRGGGVRALRRRQGRARPSRSACWRPARSARRKS